MTPPEPASPESTWPQAKPLFLLAARLRPHERAAFLAAACPDPAIRREVEGLLVHGDRMDEADSAGPRPWPVPRRLADPPTDDAGQPEVGPAPDSIAGFAVKGLLGEGASGLVYLGEAGSGARVAIKVMRPGLVSPTTWRRFALEPQIMAHLDHPGIARVLAIGTLPAGGWGGEGRPYFVTEFVAGRSLRAYAKEESLPQQAILHLFGAIGDAIQHAHSRGVIHRDLKPANILVTARGEPKVVDFGVARLLAPTWERATVNTVLGQIVGTLEYMAPEQLASSATSDIRADVYSLGAILYELLSGRPPVEVRGLSMPDALLAVAGQAIPRLASVAPDTTGDLETIIHHALARDPARRYQTVAELSADLRRFLAKEPIAARPPTLLYHARTWLRRRRLAAAATGAALALALASLFWLVVTGQLAKRTARDAEVIAESVVGDTFDYLSSLGGALGRRHAIIGKIEEPIRSLAASHPDDSRHQLNLARLLSAKADLAADEGRFDEALRLRRESLRLHRELLDREAPNDDWSAELSIAMVRLGDLLMRQRSLEEGLDLYRSALAIDESLAARSPTGISRLDQLAWSYLRLASASSDQGDLATALAYIGKGTSIVDRLCELDPSRTASLHAAFTVHGYARQLESALHAGPAPDSHFDRLLGLSDRLLAAEPHNRVYLVQHVDLLIAAAHTSFGEGPTARGFDLVARGKEAIAALSVEGVAREELLRCRAALASIEYVGLEKSGRIHEAAETLIAGIHTMEEVADLPSSGLHGAILLAGILGELTIHLSPGDPLAEEMRPHAESLIALYRRAIDRFGPWVTGPSFDMAAARTMLVLLLEAPGATADEATMATSLARRIVAHAPASGEDWTRLAQAELRYGDGGQAETAARTALGLSRASEPWAPAARRVLQSLEAQQASRPEREAARGAR